MAPLVTRGAREALSPMSAGLRIRVNPLIVDGKVVAEKTLRPGLFQDRRGAVRS